MTVGLFVANHKTKRQPGWQQIAICSLEQAERSMERGTARMMAVDMNTNQVVAVSDDRDAWRVEGQS